jgi:hypothetical protein
VPIYAAYGSNMHPEQMLERAPHSPMAGTGWLHGWRLTFGGEDIKDTREVWSWDAECVLLYASDKGYFTEDRDPEAWYSR